MDEKEKKTPAKRQIWEENIRKKYPDNDFADEDALYEASMQGYDAEHDRNKQFAADNQRLYQLLTENPDVKNFISALVSGEGLGKALSYLQPLMDMDEDSDEYASYQEGINSRKAREAEADAAIAEFDRNMKESAEALKTFAEANGMDEDAVEEFVTFITDEIQQKLFAGKIDMEFLEKFYRAFNYDADMAASEENGRIKGRNEAIEAKNKKLKKGDGLPAIQSTTTTVSVEKPQKNDTLDALDNLAKRGAARRALLD